jgi:hypothetical protein
MAQNPHILGVFIKSCYVFIFSFIQGCALGIKKTIEAISNNDAINTIQEDINKNN